MRGQPALPFVGVRPGDPFFCIGSFYTLMEAADQFAEGRRRGRYQIGR